ncbi:MAG: hypothetical protein ACK5IP_15790 [Paracoccus sp. (in: a-proteobacteria)]
MAGNARSFVLMAAMTARPMPALHVPATEQPGAFASGRDPLNGAVAATRGPLQNLPGDQRAGPWA